MSDTDWVAPYTGAWIEINVNFEELTKENVAPYTGAWIEIKIPLINQLTHFVAPYTGAWIEIMYELVAWLQCACRTLHGCVDWNFLEKGVECSYFMSHPTRVRGLK